MIIASLVLLYGSGVYLLFSGQRNAYIAAEDKDGFHNVWVNRSAKMKNTCVIWRSSADS